MHCVRSYASGCARLTRRRRLQGIDHLASRFGFPNSTDQWSAECHRAVSRLMVGISRAPGTAASVSASDDACRRQWARRYLLPPPRSLCLPRCPSRSLSLSLEGSAATGAVYRVGFRGIVICRLLHRERALPGPGVRRPSPGSKASLGWTSF